MDSQRKDLVFAFVGALGTNLDSVSDTLGDILRSFQYDPIKITLSRLFEFVDLTCDGKKSGRQSYETAEAERIATGMDKGDCLRNTARENLKSDGYTKEQAADYGHAVVALLSIREIRRLRAEHRETNSNPKAFILKSLKHPTEIDLLRKIYRDSFFSISVYSDEDKRREYLEKHKYLLPDEVDALMLRDESDETKKHGQETQKTFELGDVFICSNKPSVKADLERFIDLLFGCPKITPTLDEHGMFMAYSASLRSGDLSRQVGASIFNHANDLIAVGCNDVPCFGGGQYWPGESDNRDIAKGYDANERTKTAIAKDIYEKIKNSMNNEIQLKDFLAIVEDTQLFGITEYGRAVHAEMEAVMSCSRNGISTRNATLYCTTFPCHNCAKHLVDAGIRRVVFVEPYPKSHALKLHGDSIKIGRPQEVSEPTSCTTCKVVFEPFVGIAARRYLDLFSLKLGSGGARRRKLKGNVCEWRTESSKPNIQSDKSVVELEQESDKVLKKAIEGGASNEEHQEN